MFYAYFGIFPVKFYEKIDAFGNSYSTIMLGNQHGNTINVIIFNIIASYLYAYYEKINLKKIIILQIFVIVSYLIFGSRTALILSTFTIWGICIIKYSGFRMPNVLNKIIMFLEKYSYIIFYVLVFIIGYFMKGTAFYDYLNKLVSSRIFEVNHYLVDVGMKLLPQYVNYDWLCDNTQVKIMVSYGLIFTVIYLILSYKTIKELQKRNNKIGIFLMIMYLLYSYSEVAFFKPVSDFTMLFFVYAFQSIKCKDKENELDCGENKE